MNLAKLQMESLINEIRGNLLPGTTVTVEKMNPSILPVMGFSLEGNRSEIELKKIASLQIKPYLAATPGVSDIAVIGGLIFQGMPGEQKKARHLQSSASLLFRVFNEYDPNNLLLRQAYNEVFTQQMEETRLRTALQRIQQSRIVLTFPKRLTSRARSRSMTSW